MTQQRPRSLVAALLLTLISLTASAEEVLARKSNVGISYGAYSLQTGSGSLSSVGLVLLQYRQALNEDLSIEAAYANGVSKGFNSLFWGIDLGGSYAVGSGFPSSQKVADVATIFENRKFGVFVGGGFGMQSLPLLSGSSTLGTLIYSGPYISAQPQYYLSETLEIHMRMRYAMMVSGGNTLNSATVAFGVGLAF